MNARGRIFVLMGVLALSVPASMAEEPPAARRAAAEELVGAMGLEAQLAATLPLVADLVIQQNPAAEAYRDVLTVWANRYITWEAAKPRVVALYAETFTEAEMRDLVVFYGTPTGRKSLAVMPELTARSMAIGNELATAHREELGQMLREHDQRTAAGSAAAGGEAEGAPAGAEGAAEPSAADREASRATLAALRNVGTAMMAWVTDHDELLGGATAAAAGENWSRCPRIAHADLAGLLAPEYILEVPRVDGWGHPLEFCLAREGGTGGELVVGLRSPGRDGRFEGADYVPGQFDPADADRDIVWLDGFFIAWPQR